MRLQLRAPAGLAGGAAAAALALLAPGALADPRVLVDGRTAVYSDSDATFISTSTVALRGNPIDEVTVKARGLVDVISSASVDVVSAATDRWDEVRLEVEGSAAYHDGTRTASLAYIHSEENDWLSHTIAGSFASDFAEHTVTVGLGGSVVLNDVGRADDANFHKDLTAIGGSLDAAYVATPRDLLSATYSLSLLTGYQSSPYRFVSIEDPAAPGLPLGAPESHPDTRVRHAVGLRWIHHVFSDSAIRSQLRLYGDSWGVLSVTGGVEYVIGLDDFEIGLLARGYVQRRASFYEDVYPEPRRFMTADRELSTFLDGFGGARVGYRRAFAGSFLEELRAELKGEGFAFHFTEFSRLPSRTGIIGELALGASF
jgi:hypothetical protein